MGTTPQPNDPEEVLLIQRSYRNLLKSIKSNLTKEDKEMIRQAYEIAVQAHSKQRRKSGEPYILHPIEVARICAEEIGLGPTAVVAALLHDVVEDTSVTFEECYQFLESEEAQEALHLVTKTVGESSAQALERLLKAGNRIALLVKACDALDNSIITEGMKDYLCSNDKSPEEASNRYLEKSRVCFEALLALESNQL